MRIVLPAALPEILVGCRTGLVLALITMVTSEMIARQAGVGNILFNSLDMAQYDTVYATIVIIGVLGFASTSCSSGCARAWSAGPSRCTTSRWARHEPARRHLRTLCSGLIPIALVLALWQALISFGYAPVTLLPPPGRCSRAWYSSSGYDVPAGHGDHTVPPVRGLSHRRRGRRDVGRCRDRQPAVEAVVRPIVRVLAPVPKVALYPAFILTGRLRAPVQDRAGGRRRGVSDPARHLPGHLAVEPKLVWSARRPARRGAKSCSRWCCRRRCLRC